MNWRFRCAYLFGPGQLHYMDAFQETNNDSFIDVLKFAQKIKKNVQKENSAFCARRFLVVHSSFLSPFVRIGRIVRLRVEKRIGELHPYTGKELPRDVVTTFCNAYGRTSHTRFTNPH